MNKGRRQTDLPAAHQAAFYRLLGSLAALSLVLSASLPAWVAVSAFVLVSYCVLALFQGWPNPSSIVLAGFGLTAVIGVALWFHTLNGAQAGVSLLLLVASVKTLECRTRRDLIVVVLSGYLLTASLYLFGQGLLHVMFGLANLLWLTSVLQQLHAQAAPVPLRRQLASSGVRLLAALPLMLFLFVLFPRIDGPLWGRMPNRHQAVTGLSDGMEPGVISQLVRSQAIAFRAHFSGPPPAPNTLYWRTYVLTRFNGLAWLPPAAGAGNRNGVQIHGPMTRYTLLMRPTGKRGIPVLGLPVSVPSGTRLMPGDTLKATGAAEAVRSYVLTVATHGALLGADMRRSQLRRDLALPPHIAPQARALAARWRREDPSPEAVVARAMRYIHDQPFYYTLTPPRLPGDITDRFLFSTRQGFCEDYASAFAVLMRAADIPARVVVGYMGGHWNSALNYYTVREADAHAWVEVWLSGRGWVRVDPTAAVAASRVEAGTAETATGGLAISAAGGWLGHWTRSLRRGWDTAGYLWDTWVVAFGPAEQRALLARLGLRSDWASLAAYLAAGFALIALSGLGWHTWKARGTRVRDPALRLYRRYLRRLKRERNLAPHPNEGAQDFAQRAATSWPAHAETAATIALRYQEARYAPSPNEPIRQQRLALLRRAVDGPLIAPGKRT